MLTLKQVKSNAVLMMAVAMPVATVAPMLTASNVLAQSAPPTQLAPRTVRIAQARPSLFNRIRISAGAVIPVGTEKGEKIALTPGETKPFTLMIPQNLRSGNGDLLVPAGSKVEGEFRPAGEGTQFVAKTLVMTDGRRYEMDANSQIVNRREKIRQGLSTRSIWQGAAGGAATAAILGVLTGDKKVSLGNILVGGAVGAAGGAAIGRKEKEVISVLPNQDLSLRLNQALSVTY
ncbi:hypothetical protein IQ266_00385 [filamentous cyanobacterium LEGE 11480]|uniref:Glycine zipper 2TM domain-containing protein n=1 Tax=Romeriopsis navalis LEGE 11480 TaxID=2777977 RepID=A0A928VKI1_9CYAN|nr:hypothetical protein [Romeriopsis navalis]MBE9028210.1 hypothetical protein [Romeriopsis navalis LEGE 11480]